ncbi:hypothetical protein CDAR_204651 [Caerostris darwini]|uniref:Ycf15 n=1 Tax=Caerostris darwini TaxID=1538125 RepID=A0AAV4NCU5_9ARAC|nr:hypothetical protein CDAR_204651 [Caerostris darwini]
MHTEVNHPSIFRNKMNFILVSIITLQNEIAYVTLATAYPTARQRSALSVYWSTREAYEFPPNGVLKGKRGINCIASQQAQPSRSVVQGLRVMALHN